MKRHSMFAATAVAGALAIAMPASAGPLGVISGGAGGGVLGTLGGTLSSPASTLGLGAGGAFGGAGQFQGQITRPDLTIERLPLRPAVDAVQSVSDKAKSQAGAAADRVNSIPLPSSASGNASVQGGASAGSASAGAETSTGARTQASY